MAREWGSRTVPRHATRALLRAHLAAAAGRGHLTRHCAVCHRLLRLATDPADTADAADAAGAVGAVGAVGAADALDAAEERPAGRGER